MLDVLVGSLESGGGTCNRVVDVASGYESRQQSYMSTVVVVPREGQHVVQVAPVHREVHVVAVEVPLLELSCAVAGS